MTRYNKCQMPGCHNSIRKGKPLEIVLKHAFHGFGECPSAKDFPDGKCHHKGKRTKKVCNECYDMFENGKGIAGDPEPTVGHQLYLDFSFLDSIDENNLKLSMISDLGKMVLVVDFT